MTALTSQYVWLPTLQQLFADKDSNEFLAGGYILFYSDLNRTVGKEIFTITGSPPNYNVMPYGFFNGSGAWQINLDQDSAIDVQIYFYPYDANGNVENYFIQLYNSMGLFQFSLENIPNIPAGTNTNIITENLVPNPQFLLQYVPKATPTLLQGQITQAETPVAYGGWYFEKPSGFTSVDTVTFNRVGTPITNPVANPRYEIVVTCVTPGADAYKYLSLRYMDVNKFGNIANTYTFGFTAFANSGLNVGLYLIKNFGTGGSPSAQVVTLLNTFSLTTGFNIFFWNFSFGSNSGYTIGTNNDDNVELALGFPGNAPFVFTGVNFLLTPGNIANPVVQDLPDSIYSYQSNAGFLPPPNPDGSSLALPIIQGRTGLAFDYSNVGKIYPSFQAPQFGELLCDSTQYDSMTYSNDGIPYYRLRNAIFNNFVVNNMPLFGTGVDFVTIDALTTAASNQFTLTTNIAGATTPAADGTIPTGFTFAQVNTPTIHSDFVAYFGGANQILMENTVVGTAPNTYLNENIVNDYSAWHGTGFVETQFSRLAYAVDCQQKYLITTVAASSMAGGDWYYYISQSQGYYIWYTINGSGVDPAPIVGFIGIKVPLLSTYSAQDVAKMTVYCINGYQVTNITTLAASAIPQSAWFTFYSAGAANYPYAVWYNTAGGGTAPTPVGYKGVIEVKLTGTETATQVLLDTQIAVNSRYFAVPEGRGIILKGYDPSGILDPDYNLRFSFTGFNGGASLGNYQLDANQNHSHTITNDPNSSGSHGSIVGGAIITGEVEVPLSNGYDIANLAQGQSQSRPLNLNVNYVIKY